MFENFNHTVKSFDQITQIVPFDYYFGVSQMNGKSADVTEPLWILASQSRVGYEYFRPTLLLNVKS